MTEFVLADNLKLGLMLEAGIAKILSDKTLHPSVGSGIPRCELYLHADNVEQAFDRTVKAGATEISRIKDRNWGDTAGYLADFDGHIVVFASKKSN